MTHDQPFPVRVPKGGPDFRWACKIVAAATALANAGVELFFGPPAEQLRVAESILEMTK